MTPDSYFSPLQGQSLLYPGQSESLRGQCVQSVMMWLKETGTEPPIYPSAYQYFDKGIPGYTKMNADLIQEDDIIVYSKNFPPAGGNGHIDVAAQDGTRTDYWGWDSNWTPLKLERIHHNGSDNQYIVGILRKENMGLTHDQVAKICVGFTNLQPEVSSAFMNNIGQDLDTVLNNFENYTEHKNLLLDAQAYRNGQTAPSNVVPYSGPQLFVKK